MIKMTADGMNNVLASIGRLKSEIGQIENTLIKDSADDLVKALKRNITEQTFGDFGKPHHKKWAQRKEREGNNPGDYWLYLGRLLNAIRARRLRKEQYEVFIAGNSSSKNNPAKYGEELEKERPLFAKTKELYKKVWNKKCGDTINRIKECWY